MTSLMLLSAPPRAFQSDQFYTGRPSRCDPREMHVLSSFLQRLLLEFVRRLNGRMLLLARSTVILLEWSAVNIIMNSESEQKSSKGVLFGRSSSLTWAQQHWRHSVGTPAAQVGGWLSWRKLSEGTNRLERSRGASDARRRRGGRPVPGCGWWHRVRQKEEEERSARKTCWEDAQTALRGRRATWSECSSAPRSQVRLPLWAQSEPTHAAQHQFEAQTWNPIKAGTGLMMKSSAAALHR